MRIIGIPHRIGFAIVLLVGILQLVLYGFSFGQTITPPPVSQTTYTPVPSSLLVSVKYSDHLGLYKIQWYQGEWNNPSSSVPVPDFWRIYVPPGTIHLGITVLNPTSGAGLLARYGQSPGPITLPENWDHYPWKPPALLDQLKAQNWAVRIPAPTGCATALTCIDRWIYPPVEFGGWIFGATLGSAKAMRVEIMIDRATFDEWQSRTSFDFMGNPPLATETEDPELKVIMHLYPEHDPDLKKGVINFHRPGTKLIYKIPRNAGRAVFKIER